MSTNEKRTEIWAFVKHRKQFTNMEVVKSTGINYTVVRAFTKALVKQNIAVVVKNKIGKASLFKLVQNTPPQFTPGFEVGERLSRRKKLTCADRCWRSMRVLKKFSVSDIAQGAEVRSAYAQQYVLWLNMAGYLRCLTPQTSATVNDSTVYMLIKDTGPDRPILRMREKAVYDPNIDEVFDLNKSRSNKGKQVQPKVNQRGEHVRVD